ncbi:uncharacterized protein [Diadema antillarum]|uniref:uncharacterized protein n=1 Tax=Diadema antillarum TaxID=105358 RepID=UPI003A85A188
MSPISPARFLLIFCLSSAKHLSVSKQLFADVTSNKLTREHDGSQGLWSYHGVAVESHARQTDFIYNSDLLTSAGSRHRDIASTVYPTMGLTSDQDPVFQRYLILQARVVGIDGFLVEWGFMNHSSDDALRSFLDLTQDIPSFRIAVNWCDHWLTTELKNQSYEQVITAFHANLQYLMDTLYSSQQGIRHENSPVIFLFGGGLTSQQLRDIQALPLHLPPGAKSPFWIGSFLNFAATPELWAEWGSLLNGTFGWAPLVEKPTSANMTEWDYYGDTDDAVQYQANVSRFGRGCVSAGECVLWCGSVSPGFDNRGCAAWGKKLRFIPRQDLHNPERSTYDAQWEFHINTASSAEYIIVPTMNDFPEATPILPIMESSLQSLYSTSKYASIWKGQSIDTRWVGLPGEWYHLYKAMQFYNRTAGINVSALEEILEHAGKAIGQGSTQTASYLLMSAKKLLDDNVRPSVRQENLTLTVPGPAMTFSVPPSLLNGSYVINKTAKLYLQMSENTAAPVRKCNFKGLLRFQFQTLDRDLSYLRVTSSTRYTSEGRRLLKFFVSKGLVEEASHQATSEYSVEADRSEVCKIYTGKDENSVWQNATVPLYKQNQAWDHSAAHGSDLVFGTNGHFLVRNISLEFTMYSLR